MRRVFEHKNKLVPGFTSRYNIQLLVYYESTSSIHVALEREKQIKGWLRSKKVTLVNSTNPEWSDLSKGWFVEPNDVTLYFKQMPRTENSARHNSEIYLPGIYLFDEVCDFFFGLLFGIAITLLHQTSQFIEAAIDTVKVIVSQFSPGLFRLAADLFPFTGQYISIESYVHSYLLYLFASHSHSGARPSSQNTVSVLYVENYTIPKGRIAV
jgi:putative endonuclease